MSTMNILWAVFVAAAFVLWPIVGKFSGAPGAWVGILLLLGTSITTAAFGMKEMVNGPLFTAKAFAFMVIAGLINGIGIYVYSIKTTDHAIPTGTFIVTMTVAMTVFSPMLDWIFNGATLSLRQVGGIALAVVAIYLLQG